jgi:hypothetical protein
MVALPIEVDVSVMGSGLRGAPELDPMDPLEIDATGELGADVGPVDKGIEEFAGGIIPLLSVDEVMAVLPWSVKVVAPLNEESVTLGVRARLIKLLAVEFTDGGGMTPDAALEEAVAVESEVEKIAMPDDVVMLVRDPDVELGGGMIPAEPVERVRAVEFDVEKISMPDEMVTFGTDPDVEPGGMTPAEPVERVSAVEFDVEKISMPDEMVTFGTDPGVELGGMTPAEPVERVSAVEFDVEKISVPDEMVTFETDSDVGFGGMTPAEPVERVRAVEFDVEKISMPDEMVTFETDPDVGFGGMTPAEPVETVSAVEFDVENTTLPEDTFTLVMTSMMGGGIRLAELTIVVVVVDVNISTTGGGIRLAELTIVVVVVDVEISDAVTTPPDGKICDTFPDEALDITLAGGIRPPPPVESAVKVLLPTVKFALL